MDNVKDAPNGRSSADRINASWRKWNNLNLTERALDWFEKHWKSCSECEKCYDFTCAGAEAEKCLAYREAIAALRSAPTQASGNKPRATPRNDRYIDRVALGVGPCNPDVFEDPEYARGWNALFKIISEAQAVDFQEVVRCCECKHQMTEKCWFFSKGEDHMSGPSDDFFCADGERR